jgi:hypothetical protein
VLERWNLTKKPHILLDAAFGSMDQALQLKKMGFCFTMGMNRGNQLPWLWPFMEDDLCKGEGRVMMNKDGILASIHMDNKAHTVLTNSWKVLANRRDDDDDDDDDGDDDDDNDDVSDDEDKDKDGPDKEWKVSKLDGRKMKGKR